MQVPKSKRLRARTASTKKKTNKYVRQTKKKIFKNLISFIRVFKKLKSNQRKLVGEKKKKQNEIQTHDRRLRKRQPKKKKKLF